ncbi:MAG: DNA adenine methylase, partial [Dolichospermum sp.]
MNIKSPLRYPGGKSKAIKQISEYLPKKFSELREPFVGGGSVFIYLKQKYPDL